ncbi:PAS domain-containing protein [Streptomyces griseocarneus]|uniref:PAS domain-containing protein n=1 Tax=Streptomyces griseocarneus TaxID=51201 RepID=UPI00167D030B|nr:PAS domain-containing protein [Streptomyces griseocarneus]MBZ6475752.1 PAS domain-containing protein [Streptomyces griseocarneus]
MAGEDWDELGEDLRDFRARVRELEGARGLAPDRRAPALEAALIELRYAADVLWPHYEEQARRAGAGTGPGRREEQLLRLLFQRLPLPVALLDREGTVRRLNQEAARLLGVGAGYAAGRPLASFLRPEDRAALRTQAAAVARGDGARSTVVRLLTAGRPQGERRQLTLLALRPPGETRNAVLTVFQAPGHLPDPHPSGGGAAAGPACPVPPAAERETLLLDIADEAAAALLTVRAGEPEDVLRAVTRALRATAADWAVADLVEDTGRLRRCAVAAPPGQEDGAVAAVLRAQDPADCPVVAGAAAGGVVTVRVRPEDADCLGRDGEGNALVTRAGVVSLACLPVRRPDGPGGPAVAAVLTLLRTPDGAGGGAGPFSMAEAGVLERVARHTGLALGGPLTPPP